METIELIAPDGVTYNLTDDSAGVITLQGFDGRFLPATTRTEELVAQQAGSRLRYAQDKPRDMSMTLLFRGATQSDLRTTMREWSRRFHHLRGDSILRFTTPVGDQRELTVRYDSGFEIVESDSTNPIGTWQRTVVNFRAFEPYWSDTSDTSATFSGGSPRLFFPIFPLHLSSDSVSVTATIDNTGDVEAWPVWTVRGPGVGVAVRNLSTGRALELPTLTLGATDSITVDTRPGRKTVVNQAGVNIFAQLSANSKLWSLAPGSNQISVEVGSTSSISQVTVAYRRRWLSV